MTMEAVDTDSEDKKPHINPLDKSTVDESRGAYDKGHVIQK